jgi:hypothetical protein
MDLTSFIIGSLAGSMFTALSLALVAWRFMKPYVKAAQNKATRATNITPPPYWGDPKSPTSNDQDLWAWPQTKGDKDAN